MKAIVVSFFFLSLIIAAILFIGHAIVKLFCKYYLKNKKEKSPWEDGGKADYEHEIKLKSQELATGYFNFFIPIFFLRRR